MASAQMLGRPASVGGKTADDLLTSSAFIEDGTVLNSLGASGETVATATITTHSAGRIIATDSAELMGPSNSVGTCIIIIDGNSSLSYDGEPDDIGPTSNFVIAVNYAVTRPLVPMSLSCFCGTGVGKDDAAIAVYALGA